MIYWNDLHTNDHCLIATQAKINKTSWLWYRRVGHANIHLITKLIKRNIVKCILSLNFKEGKICDACQLGKQIRNSFKSKNIISTSRPLELYHIDIFGPTRITSLGR